MGSFPESAKGNKYLLLCLEHLTRWSIIAATEKATVKIEVSFSKETIVISFKPSGLLVSDTSTWFMSGVVQSFMKTLNSTCKPVLSYSLMSNGREELIVGTIMCIIDRVVADSDLEWCAAIFWAFFGYWCRSNCKDFGFLDLLYGVKPLLRLMHKTKQILARIVTVRKFLGYKNCVRQSQMIRSNW